MTTHLTGGAPVPQVYQSPHTHSSIRTQAIGTGFIPEASIARHAIDACGRFRGALRITGRRVGDVRLLKTSSTLLFTGLAGPFASN
jgi:hypothetical protein